MFDCRQDERTFWRTMTPVRLHALFRAYFRSHGAQPAQPQHTAGSQNPQGADPPGLADYFRGRM